DGVRVLAAGARERLEHLAGERLDLARLDRQRAAEVLRVERGVQPGATAEHQEVGERVAAEPIRAVPAAGHLTRRVEALHGRRRRVRVDAAAAQEVMAG